MMSFKTEQEGFWAGQFGSDYIERNSNEQFVAENIHFFSKALDKANKIESVTEFGANAGMNLKALKLLYPDQYQYAIEINKDAVNELNSFLDPEKVFNQSILTFNPVIQTTLSLIKGVLIHINPDDLPAVYDRLYRTSLKYILISEYYNPTPVELSYRGHSNKLFKRDFAGEFLDRFTDVKLRDYGFLYRRDPAFPQDDTTWFLMEK